jgi:hypothetical protein
VRALPPLALLAALAPAAPAFVAPTSPAGSPRRWHLNPPDPRVPTNVVNRATRAVRFHLGADGWSATNRTAELDAVRAAFGQWRAVPGTFLRCEEGPPLAGARDVADGNGTNEIVWARDTVFVNGGATDISGLTAITLTRRYEDNFALAEADIVFNGAEHGWFTDLANPTRQAYLVEAVALHEIGHFLGLNHSPVGGATLHFNTEPGAGNLQLGLAADELTAARALYGTAATNGLLARLRGTLRRGGAALFGGVVVLEDAAGATVAATASLASGAYELPAVPPGAYVARVTPLDPRLAAQALLRGRDLSAAFDTAETGFLPTTNRPVTLTAGGTLTQDFAPATGTPLRIVRLLPATGSFAAPFVASVRPTRLPADGQPRWLGVFVTNALAAADAELAVTGPGVTVLAATNRAAAVSTLNLVAVQVAAAPSAPPGLRSLHLRLGGQTAWANGYVEIPPAVPDDNFDGLDDRFQRRHWPVWTAAEAAPGADPDGDGFTNAREFAGGSDPTNRLSAHFAITAVSLTGQGARVTAETAAGKPFQLERRDTVPGAAWEAVGAPVVTPADVHEFLDPAATNRVMFYRVKLTP